MNYYLSQLILGEANMERRAGVMMAAIAAFVVGCVQQATAGEGEPVAVVHVQNDAGVPGALLGKAQEIAFDIYRAASVRTIWIGALATTLDISRALHLTVILLSPEAERRMTSDVGFDVLGLSKRSASRAYIFYQRIEELASGRHLATADVLGKVIAHEMGHLLLPPNSHSLNGIMREHLNLTDVVQRFTREQRETIHTVLRIAPGVTSLPTVDPVPFPAQNTIARK
jgi:hypothetical protein